MMTKCDVLFLVEFNTACVTCLRSFEFGLGFRVDRHGQLDFENFVNFLQLVMHMFIKMLHNVWPAVQICLLVVISRVTRYTETTKSTGNMDFAVIFVNGFDKITLEIQIKAERNRMGFIQTFKTQFAPILPYVIVFFPRICIRSIQSTVIEVSCVTDR